ncbi:MAG: hypothetical protein SynsKO_05760 [Synoicihabitans sp.]
MKTWLIGMLGLVFASGLTAKGDLSPLVVFRNAVNESIEASLPSLWVTFDQLSEENVRLREEEYERFWELRKREARKHQRFLRDLTGREIVYDEWGDRVDRQNVHTITMTPLDWLILACEPGPHRTRWARYGVAEANPYREPLLEAISQLARAAARAEDSTEMRVFREEVEELRKTIRSILAQKESVDLRDAALRFIEKYKIQVLK